MRCETISNCQFYRLRAKDINCIKIVVESKGSRNVYMRLTFVKSLFSDHSSIDRFNDGINYMRAWRLLLHSYVGRHHVRSGVAQHRFERGLRIFRLMNSPTSGCGMLRNSVCGGFHRRCIFIGCFYTKGYL